jgi:parallel beta-helix repeat protein
MVGSISRRRVVLVVAFVAALLAVPSVQVAATSGTLSVTTDTTLTEDHDGDIVIDMDNVTLDCAGHTVTGTGSGIGIWADFRTGVTVKNCDVSGFQDGIQLSNTASSTLVGNSAHDNSSVGIYLNASDGNTVTDNGADDNGTFGVLLNGSASSNTFTGNTASGNGGPQFSFDDSSDGNIVSNNSASGGEAGFALTSGSSNNTFSGNTATGASAGGFGNDVTTSANTFIDNTASGNAENGFDIQGVGNSLTGNRSHLNGWYGFSDETTGGTGDGGTDTSYSDNLCIGNGLGGSIPLGLCNTSGLFGDDDGSIFEFDIEWLAAAGITRGCNPPDNDRFCPGSFVTRGQMAAFLTRALGLTDRLDNPFTDDDTSIFQADIERLAAAGITRGCNPPTNDRFCPDSKVTRGAMAAFLVRALGYTDDGGGNLFIDDDGSIFESDIDKLGTAGVTKGCNPPTNDRFCPDSAVTRGQMAAFLHRALG